jgi:hypothetical protein
MGKKIRRLARRVRELEKRMDANGWRMDAIAATVRQHDTELFAVTSHTDPDGFRANVESDLRSIVDYLDTKFPDFSEVGEAHDSALEDDDDERPYLERFPALAPPAPPADAERCRYIVSGLRCALERGHAGDHASDRGTAPALRWPRTVSTDDRCIARHTTGEQCHREPLHEGSHWAPPPVGYFVGVCGSLAPVLYIATLGGATLGGDALPPFRHVDLPCDLPFGHADNPATAVCAHRLFENDAEGNPQRAPAGLYEWLPGGADKPARWVSSPIVTRQGGFTGYAHEVGPSLEPHADDPAVVS